MTMSGCSQTLEGIHNLRPIVPTLPVYPIVVTWTDMNNCFANDEWTQLFLLRQRSVTVLPNELESIQLPPYNVLGMEKSWLCSLQTTVRFEASNTATAVTSTCDYVIHVEQSQDTWCQPGDFIEYFPSPHCSSCPAGFYQSEVSTRHMPYLFHMHHYTAPLHSGYTAYFTALSSYCADSLHRTNALIVGAWSAKSVSLPQACVKHFQRTAQFKMPLATQSATTHWSRVLTSTQAIFTRLVTSVSLG